ncbi:MAG: MerR family transcriptional regulator, partial [Acidimicrobiia bacterium]
MSSQDRARSIGEVLEDLVGDFPDISVSKIRFLEAQGLISPARTPSGYRQFSESDVALLRWILALQREHYLPLKVIRKRLREGDGPGAVSGDAAGAEPAAEAAA